jgi:hypothetical protein
VRGRNLAWVLALALLGSAAAAQTGSHAALSKAKPALASGVPDLSGIWRAPHDAVTFASSDPPMLPWAQAKFKVAKPGYGPRATPDSTDPILRCLPPGVPRIMLMPFPMQIVQSPTQVVMIFEYDHYVRQIYLDRKEHPKDVSPTWMGDSIGRWEGNTLVVDTTGFNDKAWLDQVGHPHSDALHLIERIRRVDHDTLQVDLTIDDPKAYSKPWTGQQIYKLRPSWELIEYVCEDNMDVPR